MTKLILIRPSIDYKEVPPSLEKFFPRPTGNYYKEPPIGILYVASSCLMAGIKTKIIDQYLKNLDNEEVLREIKSEKPDFVGFSLTSFTLTNAKLLAGKIKAENRKCKIIVGGPWVTMDKNNILTNQEFDYAIYGEGEITVPELLRSLINNRKLNSIKGLIYRNHQKIIINAPRPFIKDLDTIPYPAYNLVDLNDYARGKSIYVNTEPVDYLCATRGCPYACSFCSSKEVWNRKYRTRNPSGVADEMIFMAKKYGTKGFHFRDDNLTVNRKFIINLCEEIIKRNLKIKWMCESRIDTLDEEIIAKMKESGCVGMWFGIESGSQKILKNLKKGFSLRQIRKTVNICHKYGLKIGGSFILGVPIETKRTIEETVKFAKNLKLTNTWFNQFIGIPNCELYREVKSKNMYKYNFNGNLIVETPDFTSDQLYDIVRKNNLYFEFKRIGLILTTHKLGEYPGMFLYVIKSLFSLFKS